MNYKISIASIVFTTAVALTPVHAEAPAITSQEKAAAGAKAAVGDLAGQLKEALTAALKDKGPIAALEVCKSIAPQSASTIGEQRHLTIKRTAFKVRNQANAPDEFEARILAEFLAKAESGADVQSLAYSQVIEAGGSKHLRLMKAIPMAEQPCAVCHGTQVKPDVMTKIRELYPQDQATGFLPGQMRGAFSVTVKID